MLNLETFARYFGYVVLAGYAVLTIFQLKRFFQTALSGAFPKKKTARGNWLIPLIAFLSSRLFLFAVVVLYAFASGELENLFKYFGSYLNRWDGPHYISLIENGYVSVGEEQLYIVFFPLYPMLCRAFAWTGLSALARALIVSNLFCCISAYLMYALVLETGCEKRARLAAFLLMFNPVSFFMSMPYTESIFIAFTMLTVLLARRRKFALSVIAGALAATSRMAGVAVAAPVFWEMLCARREKEGRLNAKSILLCAAQTLPMLLGVAAYLLLNYKVFGDPLKFMEFQSNHWGNRLTLLSETVRYVLINAVQYPNIYYRIGTWIPQILAIVATIVLAAATYRRQHPGDAAFLAIAFYVSVSLTWLLSGVRYVTGLYAIYPMLSLLPKRRVGAAIMLCVSISILAYMTVLGINIGYVL